MMDVTVVEITLKGGIVLYNESEPTFTSAFNSLKASNFRHHSYASSNNVILGFNSSS